MNKESFGCGFKWLITVSNRRREYTLPVKRGKYSIGVKELIFKGFPGHIDTFHIISAPHVSNWPTYISDQCQLLAVKTVLKMEGSDVIRDYTDRMEFYDIDFSSTETLQVNVVGNDGRNLMSPDVEGMIIFLVIEK